MVVHLKQYFWFPFSDFWITLSVAATFSHKYPYMGVTLFLAVFDVCIFKISPRFSARSHLSCTSFQLETFTF